MDIKELYKLWCDSAVDDSDLQRELEDIKNDDEAINDRFYRELEFGTGGLRGVIGAGTNRMNIYTVRRATQGFADYINEAFSSPSVAVSYDSRIKSDIFAKAAAGGFAGGQHSYHCRVRRRTFAGVAPRYRRLQNRALGLCFTSGMLCRVQFGWNRGV